MLTNEQIQSLSKFCEKHYVRHYDLQVELVDHLANAVEEKMQQNAKLGFEQALHEVYKGFGVMGFSTVITNRQIALQKKYSKSFWLSFLSYFTPPRIILSIVVFLLLATPIYILKVQGIEQLFISYCIIAGVIGLAGAVYVAVHYKKPKRKLLILQNTGTPFGLLGIALQVPNVYFNFFLGGKRTEATRVFSNTQVLSIIAICTILVILFLAYFETYKNVYKKAKAEYPLAFDK